jgi:thioredoxin reductase (NADPH)
VNRYPISALGGGATLKTIAFENGTSLNIDGLFFARPTATAADLAAGVGVRCASPFVSVNSNGETDQKGLFAAGDCTGSQQDLFTQTKAGHQVAQQVCLFLNR